MKPQKNQQTGMLLIEVLLSILIFSFGILGLVGLQATAIQNSTNAEERTIAANLANDIVSQMWLRKSSSTADANLSGDIVLWQARVAASALPNAAGSVVEAAGVTTVTITWKSPSKKAAENSNKFETILAIPS